eukprot:scaffold13345_cov64-Phaeocystis_antarctica.AAC.3
MWSAQARAEGLTLLAADNTTGYFGVKLKHGRSKPFEAQVSRGGKQVHLGSFATAEEAALCVVRSPEGQAAAERAAAAPSLTSEQARQQAQAEGLTLRVAENKTGYFGVYHLSGRSRPYQAQVWRGGKQVTLGSFATAEEAALCVARSPEGRAAAVERAAAPPPLTSEEARQQAQVEGLTLRVAESKTGYLGVLLHKPGQPKPYQARVSRGGKAVHLGSFATAEEAALCVARSPEGQAAAEQAAAAPTPLTSEVEGKGPFVKEEGWVPPMPPDAFVKVEVVVKEEESSGSRPKRRRTMHAVAVGVELVHVAVLRIEAVVPPLRLLEVAEVGAALRAARLLWRGSGRGGRSSHGGRPGAAILEAAAAGKRLELRHELLCWRAVARLPEPHALRLRHPLRPAELRLVWPCSLARLRPPAACQRLVHEHAVARADDVGLGAAVSVDDLHVDASVGREVELECAGGAVREAGRQPRWHDDAA